MHHRERHRGDEQNGKSRNACGDARDHQKWTEDLAKDRKAKGQRLADV